MQNQIGAYNFSLGKPVGASIRKEQRRALAATDADLRRLDRAIAGLAPSTRKSYRSILGLLDEWRNRERDGLPITDELLADYLQFLHRRGRSPGGAKLVLAAVRFRSRALGQPDPVGPETLAMMKAVKRAGIGRGKGSPPRLTREQIETIIQAAERSPTLWGSRDAALIAVGFYCGLRISELSDLRVDDVRFAPDGTATLLIRKSKTDQGGQGAVVFVPTDAVRRIQAWLAASGVESGRLFRVVARYGLDGQRALDRMLTQRSCAEAIKLRAKTVGFSITSHSLRRSFAQWLTAEGGSLQQVQLAGRWTDPTMVARYCRNEIASQSFVRRVAEAKHTGRRLRAV